MAPGTDPDGASGATSYGAVKPQLSLLIDHGTAGLHISIIVSDD